MSPCLPLLQTETLNDLETTKATGSVKNRWPFVFYDDLKPAPDPHPTSNNVEADHLLY
jgi:hypothetical protein